MANSIGGHSRNVGNWRTHPMQRHAIPLVGHAGISGGEVDLSLVIDAPTEHQPARKRDLDKLLFEQEDNARKAAKRKTRHRNRGGMHA